MKKTVSIVILCMMLVSVFAIGASAESFIPGGEYCDISIAVKKADSAAVIKDGIISENEYEKADISVSEADSMLGIAWGQNAEMFPLASEMLKTVEFYFSWDEIHGFNFAAKYKPHIIMQEFEQPEKFYSEYDGIWMNGGDDFLNQTGIHISVGKALKLYDLLHSGEEYDHGFIYRWAVAKRTTDGQYISGYYTKAGLVGDTPVPGEDYIIEYTDDGYVICEYSIDFAEIKPDAQAGDELYISIGLTAGTSDKPNENSYSINLGEYTYYMLRDREAQNGAFTLIDEQIPNNAAPVQTTSPDTTTEPDVTTAPDGTTASNGTTAPVVPTQPATTAIVTEVVTSQVAVTNDAGETETNEAGEIVTEVVTEVITSVVTEAPTESAGGNNAPVTGDPMVIATVIAAISACGIVVAKKRK